MRINWLFHSPASIILSEVFPLGVLCYGAALLINSDVEFLKANLKVNCVITTLNKTKHP